MCVGKVTILYMGHKTHVIRDTSHGRLKVIIGSTHITDFTEIEKWAHVKQTPAKHLKIYLHELQVKVY